MDKNCFRVKLQTPYGEGIVTFKKQKANFALKKAIAGENNTDTSAIDMMLEHLVSVTGLTDEANQPITAEQVKAQDVNEDLIVLMLQGYYGYRVSILSSEAAAKNFEILG